MVIEIDPKVIFDETKESFVPRSAFEFFSTYFDIHTLDKKYQGIEEFIFDYEKIKHFSDEDLCQAVCFIIPYAMSFNNQYEASEIYTKLIDRKISPEEFPLLTRGFNVSELGEFSSELINKIRWLLIEESYMAAGSATHIGFVIGDMEEENEKFQATLGEFNGPRKIPVNLEDVVDMEAVPVAMRFDDRGFLYVLDKKGVLNKYDGPINIDQYSMPFDLSYVDYNYQGNFLEPGKSLLPNIFLKDDILYFTSSSGVQVINLNDKLKQDQELIKANANIIRCERGKRPIFHDCIVKDGLIILSYSDRENRYVASKTKDGEKVIFSGPIPHSEISQWALIDLTLRMDVHNGVLYVPGIRGISMFDGKETKEMTKSYTAGGDEYHGIYPTTKFSFGKDFLVAMLMVKGTNYPSLGIFKPEYDEANIIKKDDMQVPSSFDLQYLMPMPKISSPASKHGTVAAFGDRFVVADPLFNQLFFYGMNKV